MIDVHLRSLQHLVEGPSYGDNPQVQWQMNGSRDCGIYIHCGILCCCRKGKLGRSTNSDGPGRHLLSEISHREKDKCWLLSPTSGTERSKVRIYGKPFVLELRLSNWDHPASLLQIRRQWTQELDMFRLRPFPLSSGCAEPILRVVLKVRPCETAEYPTGLCFL